jgi:hypothetical protein
VIARLSIFALALIAILDANAARAADTIVNISGTANGENIGNESCAVTCNGSLIDPVQVTLGAGTYSVTDAWSEAHGLEPGALYDAWNFEAGNSTGWAWHWKVLTDDGSDGSTIDSANYASHLLQDIDPTQEFATETEAADFGTTTSIANIVLSGTTTLDFVVNDYDLNDNAGGVSLDIACVSGACSTSAGGTNSVPEPASMTLFGSALFALGALRYRKRRASRTSS